MNEWIIFLICKNLIYKLDKLLFLLIDNTFSRSTWPSGGPQPVQEPKNVRPKVSPRWNSPQGRGGPKNPFRSVPSPPTHPQTPIFWGASPGTWSSIPGTPLADQAHGGSH